MWPDCGDNWKHPESQTLADGIEPETTAPTPPSEIHNDPIALVVDSTPQVQYVKYSNN
jgi:hypothetical protein